MYAGKFTSKLHGSAMVWDNGESHMAQTDRLAGLFVPKYCWRIRTGNGSVSVYADTPKKLMDARNQLRQQVDEGLTTFSVIGYVRKAKFDSGELDVWFLPEGF